MSCLLIVGPRPLHPVLHGELSRFAIADHRPKGSWTCVFRWGGTEGADGGGRVVNRRDAIANCEPDVLGTILQAGDIPFYPSLLPRWRVYVFDLRIVASYQSAGRRWRRAPLPQTVRDVARRALYAAGLHFGAVDVAALSGGRAAVVRILPAPPLNAALARRFAGLMLDYAAAVRAEEDGLRHEVVLGADPEFVLRNRRTGRTVSAARFFSRWGVVGLDRAYIKRNGVNFYPLAEVRPPPSPDPLQLVENLRRAVAQAAARVRGHAISFQAGGTSSRRFTIGGHIHFSNVRLTTDLLQALDNYVALPLLFLENPVSCRRRRPRYGFLGDWRPQPHGGFEYRTLASWLVSPQYAAAALCLAKAVVQDYPLLLQRVLIAGDRQRAFYSADKDALRPHFWSLWRDLHQSPVFNEWKQYIEVVHDMVSAERRWNERMDLKRRWLAS